MGNWKLKYNLVSKEYIFELWEERVADDYIINIFYHHVLPDGTKKHNSMTFKDSSLEKVEKVFFDWLNVAFPNIKFQLVRM